MDELLLVRDLCAGYDESVILDHIGLSLQEGDSLAVLGRNGVGKTTLLTTLMGFTRLHGGDIFLKGENIVKLPAFKRVRAGLGWVPQERLIFPSLTVREHLTAVACPGHWDIKRIYGLLPRLEERQSNFANQLSGGEQQMLAIARALMVNPKLLLLDEPFEGLAPIVIEELARVVRGLVDAGTRTAVIIVEQHAKLALTLARNAITLDRGRIVHQSDSQSLLADPVGMQRLIAMT
jgi:branched-chain amino acid transport system ATP-binding protein